MARTRNILWGILIPLVIFASLSVSAYFFMLHRMTKGGHFKVDEKCPTPWVGTQHYQRKYLGGYAPPLEQILCVLVTFFDTIFKQDASRHSPFLHDFLTSFAAPITIITLEASRSNRSFLLSFPLVWGMLGQVFGAGVVFPVYWGLFLATLRRNAIATQIDQASAEAALFGVGMGYVLPVIAMIYYHTIETIAIWQPFPLWIFIFEYLHLLLRPRRIHSGSGYRTVQATYVLVFLGSAIAHVRALSAYNFDPQTLVDNYLPTIMEPTTKGGSAALAACIHFLQWDGVFIFGSALLATLWFAESILQGVGLMIWSFTSFVLLGPGAAIAGIFLWREKNLKDKRVKQVPAVKLSKTH